MSATGRGATRAPSDYYPSPAWTIWRLLERLSLPGGAWLEPAAGDGAIIRAVTARRSDVTWSACELRGECAEDLARAVGPMGSVAIGDFLAHAPPVRFAVAILNPPFSHAQAFIERCKPLASWVIALERLNFLGSEERSSWAREDMPDIYVLPNRPSFTGAGTDSIEYAWFAWGPERGRRAGRVELLDSTPAAERRVPRLVLPKGVGEPLQGGLL